MCRQNASFATRGPSPSIGVLSALRRGNRCAVCRHDLRLEGEHVAAVRVDERLQPRPVVRFVSLPEAAGIRNAPRLPPRCGQRRDFTSAVSWPYNEHRLHRALRLAPPYGSSPADKNTPAQQPPPALTTCSADSSTSTNEQR
jgi:hypothetical protein